MDLQTASLGQPAMINLGGYVPAAAQRRSITQEALAAFLQGAAGAAGGRLVNAAMTPDVSETMRADKDLQAQGMAPEKRGTLAKFFAPKTQEEYDRMKQIAGQRQDAARSYALDNQRLELARSEAGAAERHRQSTEKTQREGLELERQRLMSSTAADRAKMQQDALEAAERSATLKAQARAANAASEEAELRNKTFKEGQQKDATNQLRAELIGDPKAQSYSKVKDDNLKKAITSLGQKKVYAWNTPYDEYRQLVVEEVNKLQGASNVTAPTVERPSLLRTLAQPTSNSEMNVNILDALTSSLR